MSGKYLLSHRRDVDAVSVDQAKQQLLRFFGANSVIGSTERMTTGQDLRLAIDQAIKDCGGMLVVIGPGWLTATDNDGGRLLDCLHDPVRLEVAAAIAAGKVVIPLLVDGAQMPRADQLPEELAALTQSLACSAMKPGTYIPAPPSAAWSAPATANAAAAAPSHMPPRRASLVGPGTRTRALAGALT